MSLFFNERIVVEQKEEKDPSKDTIIFTYPWIIEVLTDNQERFMENSSSFRTKYKYHAAAWLFHLNRTRLTISNPSSIDDDDQPHRDWNGSSCFISYKLYYDMEVLLYSSSRVKMVESQTYDSFRSPRGYMENFEDSLNGEILAKIVIFIELHLPIKNFYRPFDIPSCYLSRKLYNEYPKDMEKNFRYDFLNESDYVIKCPDGSMPASRVLLNISSYMMKKHFETASNDNELVVVEHLMDVVKPVVTYLHTCYFQMPKSFDLNYAKRLLKAIKFFNPVGRPFDFFESFVHQALCKKFVEEDHTFDSILKWIFIAFDSSEKRFSVFYTLQKMIATVVADKFYFKWYQTFPEAARNSDNQIFRDTFGQHPRNSGWFFNEIESIMSKLFSTNVIIQ